MCPSPFLRGKLRLYRAEWRGKSTVLSIMSRLLNADSGEIYLNGELLNRKKSSDIAKTTCDFKANEQH